MRVAAKQGHSHISFQTDMRRPIIMHVCGTTYRMDVDEALSVANDRADAVAGLREAQNRTGEGDDDVCQQD